MPLGHSPQRLTAKRPSTAGHLRLQAFDTSTEEGRNSERYRLAALSVVANVFSKVVAMVLMVVSVKLTVPYLGAERFGIWMTVLSFAAMLTFLDLGVGNALTNHVAKNAAARTNLALQQAISGGLGFLMVVGLSISVILYLATFFLPWNLVVKTSDPENMREVQDAARVFACFFGLTIFTSGVQKVFLGLQRSFESHFSSAATTLMTIFVLWGAARHQAPVPVLLAITLAGQACAAVPLLMLLIARRQFSITSLGHVTVLEAPALVRTGGMFLALQIGAMIGWGADSVIISATLGASYVGIYAVVQRLFQVSSVPLAILNQPLWGAYADAHARGDREFIALSLKRSMLMTAGLAALFALLIVIFHADIVAIWTDGKIVVPIAFLVAFAFWALLEAVATCASMYMNGCAIFKPQMAAVIVFCATSIPLKFVLVEHFGLFGVVMSTILAYLISVPLMYALFFSKAVTAPLRTA